MSADGSVTIEWGDGEHRFRLAIGQLRDLQEKINQPRAAVGSAWIGPRTLLRIMAEGDAWPEEVGEVVRLGLIGGGMKPPDALARVRRYVYDRPLLESTPLARTILMAALIGVPDDPVGKKPEAERSETTISSASQASMERAPPSAGQAVRSTTPRSGSSAPPSTDGTPPRAGNSP